MNKTAIKNFAVWARRKLIADITYKMGMLGITDSGIATPLPQSTRDLQFFDVGTKNYSEVKGEEIAQRKALVDALKLKERSSDYKTAFETLVEEVAYTWFNRLIAVRFMEVNDYLPSRVRVLSSLDSAKSEPDFVTNPFETDLEFTPEEQELIFELKDKNKLDELFRMLFIKQCNKLNEILPELFEKTNDYTELLLTISFTDKDGVVYRLVHDISENDFDVEKEGQVEIIGWLYQYYVLERHEEVIDPLHGKVIKKDDIPAATQLFTTDWVVKYIVDNSLGRYWLERNKDSKLSEKMEFLVTSKEDTISTIDEYVDLEELKVFDPCMGSGHFLVYAFDLLMHIYEERGWTTRDAAKNIVEKNLYGLDIDKRASQLAYFAVMMKARQYNRRILGGGTKPNVLEIKDSSSISDNLIRYASFGSAKAEKEFRILCDTFADAKELGSIIVMPELDIALLESCIAKLEDEGISNLDSLVYRKLASEKLAPLVKQARIMQQKYDVVVTNPPYLNKLDNTLKEYVNINFKNYSGDLFSVFMFKNFAYCKNNGYSGFMTPNVWMFIKTYENLRKYIIDYKSIVTLVQMAKGAFFKEATVDVCAFVLRNNTSSDKGLYIRLEDFKGDMEIQKEKVIESLFDNSCRYFYETDDANFLKIPGSPIAYWWRNYSVFDLETIAEYYESAGRNKTHDNNKYVRKWWEIFDTNRWQPYANGGLFRRWAGNDYDVVDWSTNAKDFYMSNGGLYNQKYNGVRGVCWNLITSYKNGFRIKIESHHYSSGAPTIIAQNKNYDFLILAFLNSVVATKMLEMLNPTLNTTVGDVLSLPLCLNNKEVIEEISSYSNILSHQDWDSFETSWNFKNHPLVEFRHSVAKAQINPDFNNMSYFLKDAYEAWEYQCQLRFDQLKSNEEELNRIFIDIYGLQDELTPEVEDKDVTVRKADLQRDIKSLISYAVGCMFGRYSIYKDGLMFAGGEWNSEDYKYAAYEASNPNGFPKDVYSSNWFMPDEDNCIPVTDEEYFEDDVVGRFVNFIKTVYGEETLEENLDFIASALGNKGSISREVIRNYFLNDFIKDHIKTYQKRPIYWMFDSGKQNGFKALVYMHRWDSDTIGNMRVEYLHRMQRVYENEIIRMQETIDNSANNREVAASEKRKDKLQKQLKESKDFDAKVANLALSRIDIDLDDGVKVNYQKVQTTTDGKNMGVLFKI